MLTTGLRRALVLDIMKIHFTSWAWRQTASAPSDVQGIMLNCIHIFIVFGSFLYWCVMSPASQRFFIHSCIYLLILIISYSATFLGTNSLSVLMCRIAVNQSIHLWAHGHETDMSAAPQIWVLSLLMIGSEFTYLCFRCRATRLDWSKRCCVSGWVRNQRWRPVTGSEYGIT